MEEVEPEGEMDSDGRRQKTSVVCSREEWANENIPGGLGCLLWGRLARASPPSMMKISLGGKARLPFQLEILGRY